MNNRLIYSFDIGTSSIGWSVRDLDENYIVDLGVRLFDIPEKGKERKTSCSIRREQRSTRRLLKRKKRRINDIKNLIIDNNILTKEEVASLYEFDGFVEDIYKLRYDALNIPINNLQLCRILLYFGKNRGYKSNSKQDILLELDSSSKGGDIESKKVLSSISANKELMTEKGYRSIGEMLYLDSKFESKKKNTTNQYISSFSREDVINEIQTILKIQRGFGNNLLTEEFEDKYINIIKNQLPFLLKKDMEKMIGECSLIQGEKRAAKNTYTFERFVLLSKLNNLLIDDKNLTEEERTAVLNLAYKQKTVKYATLRKTLNLDSSSHFNLVDYSKYNSVEEAEKSLFIELNGYHSLKKVFSVKGSKYWESLSKDIKLLDEMAYIISTCKDINEFKENILTIVDEEFVLPLFSLDFSTFGNISIKAIEKIVPFMEDGDSYYHACIKAGLNPDGYVVSAKKEFKISPSIYDSLTNTRIIRIVSEFRKVYNNMVSLYSPPSEVNIELAREIAMSKKRKDKYKKEQALNEKVNALIIKDFEDSFGRKPKSNERFKYKLWKEQNGVCLYSGKVIPKDHIIDDSKLEVDHAIHISLSGDDSINNKVLVLKEENQNKGARTPFEYIGHDKDNWESYINRVDSCNFSSFKKNKLKSTSLPAGSGFITRYLNDTREVSSFLYKYIKNNLKGHNDENIKVRCVNGGVTSFLRGIWGIPKDRDTVYHHIEDSLLVGCCDEKFIQRVSNLSKRDSLYKEKINPSLSVKDMFPLPYDYFIDEIKARLSNSPSNNIKNMMSAYNIDKPYTESFIDKLGIIYPSFKLSRKLQGQIHPETVHSKKKVEVKRNCCEVRGGTTSSGVFVRIDLFKSNGKFKIVPLYRHELKKGLSNISFGFGDESKLIVKEEDFVFSLYKNDTVIIQQKNSVPLVASYVSTDSSTGSVKFQIFEDGRLTEKRLGIATLLRFEKIDIDVLGRIHKLKFKSREEIKIECLK